MDQKSEKEEIQVCIQTNEAFEYEKNTARICITFKFIHFKSFETFFPFSSDYKTNKRKM